MDDDNDFTKPSKNFIKTIAITFEASLVSNYCICNIMLVTFEYKSVSGRQTLIFNKTFEFALASIVFTAVGKD